MKTIINVLNVATALRLYNTDSALVQVLHETDFGKNGIICSGVNYKINSLEG